jgi:hypothetical protein
MRTNTAIAAAAMLLGATAAARAEPSALSPIAASGAQSPTPWHVVGLPSQTKPFTAFTVTTLDGRRAVRVDAEASYGNLVHPLDGKPGEAPGTLAWQWRLEMPLDASDLREKQGDDVALKVCASFDEPLDRVPFAERQLLRFARSRTAEPVPSATVCYVWDTRLAPGTLLDSPFTRRLRYIVLQSGRDRLGRWVAEKRDLAADFRRAFGAESPTVPPLVGLAVGADADNTKGHSLGFVADLALEP